MINSSSVFSVFHRSHRAGDRRYEAALTVAVVVTIMTMMVVQCCLCWSAEIRAVPAQRQQRPVQAVLL